MRTHLLTGAGSGIGAAVARRLSERGDRLVLVARSKARVEALLADFPGSQALVADLAEPEALEVVLASTELPPALDSVLHIAGVVDLGPVAEAPLAEWREHLSVNLLAPFLLTRACLPAVRRTQGTVLFVNSSAGLSASAAWGAYAASKFGLRALADALRSEEIGNGVRVTTVFPSRTATPMQEKVHEQEGGTYDPARWISPETVAETILHVLDLPRDATIPEVTVRPVVPRPS